MPALSHIQNVKLHTIWGQQKNFLNTASIKNKIFEHCSSLNRALQAPCRAECSKGFWGTGGALVVSEGHVRAYGWVWMKAVETLGLFFAETTHFIWKTQPYKYKLNPNSAFCIWTVEHVLVDAAVLLPSYSEVVIMLQRTNGKVMTDSTDCFEDPWRIG